MRKTVYHTVSSRNQAGMDAKTLFTSFILLSTIIFTEAWQAGRSQRELRSEIHHHSKRHMLPREIHEVRLEARRKRRSTTQRNKEMRKKPSGHLKPLQDDDMENDEIVSVAVGPPAVRPKYDKLYKYTPKSANRTIVDTNISTNFVKNVLVQLGREFLTHQVSEDFVFGQYVGNSMKNLTNELKLKMQHEILDIIVKYHKLSRGELSTKTSTSTSATTRLAPEEATTQFNNKIMKVEKRLNDKEEVWPDFSNLANIVG